MSRQVIAPQGYVLGDGTTAGKVASERWKRWRWAGIVTILVVGSLLAMALFSPATSEQRMGIDNPGPNGAMALAEVLKGKGVDVRGVSTLDEADKLLDDTTTLVIATFGYLSWEQIESINRYGGPVVWLQLDNFTVGEIDVDLSYEYDYTQPDERATLAAECSAATPARAHSVSVLDARIAVWEGNTDLTLCFTGGSSDTGAYLLKERANQGDVVLISDPTMFTNEHVTRAGNAALALGILGTTQRVVWYTGDAYDYTTLGGNDDDASEYFEPTAPGWLAPAMLAGVLTLVLAALWQGRRFGSLVTEPLPLVVKASEATRGRARLYRRSGARDHALAALRAGAASRMASRLAVPRTAAREELIAAIAAASGRDGAEVKHLLFDATTHDDAAMVDLVRRIDALESEVDPT